jgi:uncharacterized membrane protein
MNASNIAPQVRRFSQVISYSDVMDCLYQGLNDFARAPLFGFFFGGFYALGGYALMMLLQYYRSIWLILPLALGFPLIGPFVAAGLYEVSRRLEAKLPLRWSDVLAVILNQSRREMGWMAFAVLFIFWVWIYQVRLLLALFLVGVPLSSLDSISGLLSQPQAYEMLAAGTVVGAFLSAVLFCTTVVAMPMLMDRPLDFVTAIIGSWRCVLENLGPMIFFGLVVAVVTFVALAPFFLGLFVALPVLGHATWHVYRRLAPRI